MSATACKFDYCLTPPALAKRWGITPEKIIAFIRRGELRAFDVASPGSNRPRFRIPADAVVEFENRRSAKQPAKVARRKRKKQDDSFVNYF